MNRLGAALAGIDFSGADSDAAMWAGLHLAPERIVLGHVVPAPRTPSFLPFLAEGQTQLHETIVAGARARVQALARELSEDVGRPYTGEVRTGDDVAGQLDRLATEIDADLIVLGPHDRRKGIWSPLGTVSARVLHAARRPTLIVRGDVGRRPERVVAAVDESAVSARVLEWFAWAMAELDATGVALHVIDFPVRDYRRAISQSPGATRGETEIEERASEWLRERLDAAGLQGDFDARVALGDPVLEILATVQRDDAGLLIMGTRGTGAIERFFMGTVAQGVARKAGCPVLLLPAPD